MNFSDLSATKGNRVLRSLASVTNQGFTLLEVVIALSIVAISVLAIASAMNAHTSTASELEQRVIASWIANNQIASLRHESKVDRIKSGRSSDRVDMAGHKWRTQTKIEKTDVDGVFLVTVTVNNDDRRSDVTYAKLITAISDVLGK